MSGARVLVITIILVALRVACGLPCTCFCFYDTQPLYGMNFDYPESEIRFSIETGAEGLVFFGSVFIDGHYGRTVGMNAQGLFASDQMVSPLRNPADEEAPGEIYVWRAFYEALTDCATVNEVRERLADQRLVSYPELALHDFFADPSSDAFVIEAGNTGNVATPIDGQFLVMTNFHNGDFRGDPPAAVRGDGADRYRIACAALASALRRPASFDVAAAFELLHRASTSSGTYKTRYSLVLDPRALVVYIALERDMDHLWRVSLRDQTIETYQGFSRYARLPLDATGVVGSLLTAYAEDDPPAAPTSQPVSAWPRVLFGTLLLAMFLFAILGQRR